MNEKKWHSRKLFDNKGLDGSNLGFQVFDFVKAEHLWTPIISENILHP